MSMNLKRALRQYKFVLESDEWIQNNYKRKEETIVRDKENSEYTFFAETAHHRKTTGCPKKNVLLKF